VLFELEHSPEMDPGEALRYHAEEAGDTPTVTAFAAELIEGVRAHQAQLDEEIQAASTNWRMDQMGRVDRIVLRMAVFEIAISRKVPVRAAINESIELAKTFAGDESGRFVNGILGRVAETAAR
jgi:N utilization substance protein B